MFGPKSRSFNSRLSGYANALETAVDNDPSRYGIVIDMAADLRRALSEGNRFSLTIGEKLAILKSLTKAKLRALKGGARDNYHMFKTLDMISSDLVQLL